MRKGHVTVGYSVTVTNLFNILARYSDRLSNFQIGLTVRYQYLYLDGTPYHPYVTSWHTTGILVRIHVVRYLYLQILS